jgi:hypothetical protein
MKPKALLTALINMRSEMLRKGVCKKNPQQIQPIVTNAMAWLQAWTPSDEQCANYIKRHWAEVEMLLPGGDTKQAKLWRERYQQIVNA